MGKTQVKILPWLALHTQGVTKESGEVQTGVQADPDKLEATILVGEDVQQALVVTRPELGLLVGHAEQIGVQLWEGQGIKQLRNSRLGCSPPLSHREGPPTCSRCRTLLARRSNTTRLWSSLPEMMCLSSASTASTALECSLRLFTRAKPAGVG